jgi:hypothetical protein
MVVHGWSWTNQAEKGLQGVFKPLRRNRNQLEKGCCEQLSSDCRSKEAEPQKNSPCVRGMTYGVQAQPQTSTQEIVRRDSCK